LGCWIYFHVILAFFVLLLASNVRSENKLDANLVFKNVGTLFSAHATIQLVLEVDLSFLRRHCDTLRDQTKNNNDDAFSSPPSLNRQYRALLRLTDSTCHEVDQLSAVEHHHRQERQIWMAAAAFTSIFSLYEAVQVHHLANEVKELGQQQHRLAGVLQHQQGRLNKIEENVAQQAKDLADMLDVEQAQTTLDHKRFWLQERTSHVLEFANDVHQATQGLQEARRGHLSPFFFAKKESVTTFACLQQRAVQLGGRLPFDHAEDLYRVPITTVTGKAHQYQLLVHVPVTRGRLRLYRYRPSPVIIKDEDGRAVTLVVKADKTLLAHNDQEHQELSDADLMACDRNGNTYVCAGPTAFHTQLHGSCLGALFSGDAKHVRQLCPVQQSNVSWYAENVDEGKLALYFREPTHVGIVCKGAPRNNTILHGNVIIHLAANCTLDATDLRITATSDALLRLPVDLRQAWGAEDFLEGTTPQRVQEIRARLQERQRLPEGGLRDLQRQETEINIEEQVQKNNVASHLYLVLLTSVLMGLILFLGCARYMCLCFKGLTTQH
jgi:hypothetical protein